MIAALGAAKDFGARWSSKGVYAANFESFRNRLCFVEAAIFPARPSNLRGFRGLNVSRSLPAEVGIELSGGEQAADVVDALVTRAFEIFEL